MKYINKQGKGKLIKLLTICIILGLFSILIYFLYNVFTYKKVTTSIEFTQDIWDVKIEFNSTDLTIIQGDTLKIDTDKNDSIITKKIKNTLLIKDNNLFNKSNKVTITLPKYLNEVEIEFYNKTLNINDLNINSFNLEQKKATINVNNLISNNTDIESASGNLTINNSTLKNLDLEISTSQVYFSGTLLYETEIEQNNGDLTLDLTGSDYLIKAQKGFGTLTIDDVVYQSDTITGAGYNTIEIESGRGNTTINTNK